MEIMLLESNSKNKVSIDSSIKEVIKKICHEVIKDSTRQDKKQNGKWDLWKV